MSETKNAVEQARQSVRYMDLSTRIFSGKGDIYEFDSILNTRRYILKICELGS